MRTFCSFGFIVFSPFDSKGERVLIGVILLTGQWRLASGHILPGKTYKKEPCTNEA